MSMKISLPGVLERAAEACKRPSDERDHGLAFSLRELLKHLRQVRKDPELIGEFLELWTDSEGKRCVACGALTGHTDECAAWECRW